MRGSTSFFEGDWPGRIKSARREKKLSQKALSEMMTVSPMTISSWETGKQTPSQNLKKLAHTLGVQPMWIASGGGPLATFAPQNSGDVADEIKAHLSGRGPRIGDLQGDLKELVRVLISNEGIKELVRLLASLPPAEKERELRYLLGSLRGRLDASKQK